MSKRILVPVDGSRAAEAAVPVAIAIAKKTGAELRLALVREATSLHAQTYLDKTTTLVRQQLTSEDASASSVVLKGSVVPALCREAEAADLVVMSSHGHGGFVRLWIGSVTDAVLRRTSVPLMIVKPGNEDVTPHASISRIVVPLDGSNAAETAVGSALWLAGHFGAAVTLYRAVSPAGTASAAIHDSPKTAARLLSRLKRDARTHLEAVRAKIPDGSCPIDVAVGVHRSPASGILKFAKKKAADMIVIAAQTRSPLKRALIGSVADKVVRGSSIPVLVVRGWRGESPPPGEG